MARPALTGAAACWLVPAIRIRVVVLTRRMSAGRGSFGLPRAGEPVRLVPSLRRGSALPRPARASACMSTPERSLERVSALVVPASDRAITVDGRRRRAPAARPPGARRAGRGDAWRGSSRRCILAVGPPGVDAAAHLYHTRAFEEQGWRIWDNYWYAGRYDLVNYSVLYYPLAAALGQAMVAVGAVDGLRGGVRAARAPARRTAPAGRPSSSSRSSGRPSSSPASTRSAWACSRRWCRSLLWLHGRPLAGLLAARRRAAREPARLPLPRHRAGRLRVTCRALVTVPRMRHRRRRRAARGPRRGRSCCACSPAAASSRTRCSTSAASRSSSSSGVLLARRSGRLGFADRPAGRLPGGQRRRRDLPERRRRQRRAARGVHLAADAAAAARRPPLPAARWLAVAVIAVAVTGHVVPVSRDLEGGLAVRADDAAFWERSVAWLQDPDHASVEYRVHVVSTWGHWESYYLASHDIPITRGWFRQDDFPVNRPLYSGHLDADSLPGVAALARRPLRRCCRTSSSTTRRAREAEILRSPGHGGLRLVDAQRPQRADLRAARADAAADARDRAGGPSRPLPRAARADDRSHVDRAQPARAGPLRPAHPLHALLGRQRSQTPSA